MYIKNERKKSEIVWLSSWVFVYELIRVVGSSPVVTIVNNFKPLTIITNSSILDIGVLQLPLTKEIQLVLELIILWSKFWFDG